MNKLGRARTSKNKQAQSGTKQGQSKDKAKTKQGQARASKDTLLDLLNPVLKCERDEWEGLIDERIGPAALQGNCLGPENGCHSNDSGRVLGAARK